MSKKAKGTAAVKDAPAATPPATIAGKGNPGIGAVKAAEVDELTAMAMGTAPAPASATAKKSKVPVVEIPELADVCQEFIAADRDLTDAENRKDAAALRIKKAAEAHRVAYSRRVGENTLSIKINGVLNYTVGRYRVLKDTVEKPLAAIVQQLTGIFGEGWKTFFGVNHEFSVRKEATNAKNIKALQEVFKDDPVRREAIAKVIGMPATDIPKFADLIERVTTVVPNDALHTARTLNADVEKQYEQAKAAELVLPAEGKVMA